MFTGKRQLKKGEIYSYLFLGMVSIQYGLLDTQLKIIGLFSTILMTIDITIFLGWLFSNKIKVRVLIAIMALLSIATLTYFFTGETLFMVMLMAAIITCNSNYENIINFIFKIRLVILILIILLSLCKLLDAYKTIVYKGGIGTSVLGYGLGFTHPNRLAYAIGFLLLLYICYRNNKIKKINILVIFAITYFTYYITKTRAFIIIVVMTILLLLVIKYSKDNGVVKRIFKSIAPWIMPVCALISLGLPMLQLYSSGKLQTILYFINGYIGSRFTHIYRALITYRIPIFGGVVEFASLEDKYGYSTVDNGYLRLLYEFGIVGFVIFLLFYFFIVRKLIKNRQYIFVIAIIALAVWGIFENILRSFAINFTVVFWSEMLRGRVIKRERVHRENIQPKTSL